MAATAFEPSRDVALVGAVFPVPVAVGRERLTTSGASEIVHGFLVQLIRVRVPPFFAASPGAEHARFPFFHLRERRTAFLAEVGSSVGGGGFLLYGYMVPAAVGLDGIPGDTDCFADLCIADTRAAEFSNPLFLFVGHGKMPPSPYGHSEAVLMGYFSEKNKPVSIPKNTHRANLMR